MKEEFSLKKKTLNYLIIIILITTFLTENVIADSGKIDQFSISIKSQQRIDDLTMNCTFEINEDRDTDVTYDISVRSEEKIEFIEFYLTPSFDNPILINKRIIYGDNKRIEEFLKTNNIYFQINTDNLNKIISERYEIHFFIKFSVKTENIADLNSASPNNIIFGYNYITGESILPSRVRADIWLPEDYRIDTTMLGEWHESYTFDKRFWYYKEVFWKDKNNQPPYLFYFMFFQLPKNVEEQINNLNRQISEMERNSTIFGIIVTILSAFLAILFQLINFWDDRENPDFKNVSEFMRKRSVRYSIAVLFFYFILMLLIWYYFIYN